MLFNTFLHVYCPGVNTKIICFPGRLEVLQRFITGCSPAGGEGMYIKWNSPLRRTIQCSGATALATGHDIIIRCHVSVVQTTFSGPKTLKQ